MSSFRLIFLVAMLMQVRRKTLLYRSKQPERNRFVFLVLLFIIGSNSFYSRSLVFLAERIQPGRRFSRQRWTVRCIDSGKCSNQKSVSNRFSLRKRRSNEKISWRIEQFSKCSQSSRFVGDARSTLKLNEKTNRLEKSSRLEIFFFFLWRLLIDFQIKNLRFSTNESFWFVDIWISWFTFLFDLTRRSSLLKINDGR